MYVLLLYITHEAFGFQNMWFWCLWGFNFWVCLTMVSGYCPIPSSWLLKGIVSFGASVSEHWTYRWGVTLFYHVSWIQMCAILIPLLWIALADNCSSCLPLTAGCCLCDSRGIQIFGMFEEHWIMVYFLNEFTHSELIWSFSFCFAFLFYN